MKKLGLDITIMKFSDGMAIVDFTNPDAVTWYVSY